jgi:hypothetical protein
VTVVSHAALTGRLKNGERSILWRACGEPGTYSGHITDVPFRTSCHCESETQLRGLDGYPPKPADRCASVRNVYAMNLPTPFMHSLRPMYAYAYCNLTFTLFFVHALGHARLVMRYQRILHFHLDVLLGHPEELYRTHQSDSEKTEPCGSAPSK